MTAFEGVRSVVYPARDLPAAVEAWRAALGRGPIWESPDYAAFDAGHGTEIGLSRLPWFDHPVTFWKVADIEAAWQGLTATGAVPLAEVAGGGMADLAGAEVANGDPATGIVGVPGRKLAVLRVGEGGVVGLMQDLPVAW